MSSGPKSLAKLQDHRVLVVGGSSGIGYAVAEAALEYGANVIISSSNQGKLDKAVSRLQEHLEQAKLPSRQILAKICNLADPETVEENIKALLESATEGGKLDHVVYTAGDALKIQGLETVTIKDLHDMAMVRVTAATLMAKYLPKYVNSSLRSSYTITGGTMSKRPGPGWAAMLGAAGGGDALARGLAIDLKPIRANCVEPGAVRTEVFNVFAADKLDEVLEGMRKGNITNTVGTPEEVAEAYLYFMKNTFVTGATVVSDGGRLVGDSKGGH